MQYLSEIYDYREEDARTFAKALRGSAADMPNSDATLAEIIVYRYNIRLVHEGIIRSVRLARQEWDVIVERLDGSSAYLAVRFNLPLATTDAEPRSLPWKKPMNPFITDDECGRESDQPHTTRET